MTTHEWKSGKLSEDNCMLVWYSWIPFWKWWTHIISTISKNEKILQMKIGFFITKYGDFEKCPQFCSLWAAIHSKFNNRMKKYNS
jgi:hypothetical protein